MSVPVSSQLEPLNSTKRTGHHPAVPQQTDSAVKRATTYALVPVGTVMDIWLPGRSTQALDDPVVNAPVPATIMMLFWRRACDWTLDGFVNALAATPAPSPATAASRGTAISLRNIVMVEFLLGVPRACPRGTAAFTQRSARQV